MWRIVQQDEPGDYVLATGETHSVREFVDLAFAEIGMPLSWRGSGLEETGVDAKGHVRVRIDARYFRPTEVDLLLGDARKARQALGWSPKTTFADLVKEMVASDLRLAEEGRNRYKSNV
jgi:GDPmannose 4,6-dehydratase